MTMATEPADGPEVEDLPEVEAETNGPDDLDEDEVSEPDDDNPDGDGEGDEAEPEAIEVEYEGKTYKVPPELRDSLMRQADYTRKTQEVAHQRKALEARIATAAQASEAERDASAHLAAIDAALKQYENTDWRALHDQDPDNAQRHFYNHTLLKQHREQAEKQLGEARSSREAETQQIAAERFMQSMDELKASIPEWSEKKIVELRDFARDTFGFTDEEFLSGLHDARQIKMLNLARTAALAAKGKPKQPAAQAPKAASKVRGGSAPKVGLDDRLSDEEWAKRRNAQMAKKRNR